MLIGKIWLLKPGNLSFKTKKLIIRLHLRSYMGILFRFKRVGRDTKFIYCILPLHLVFWCKIISTRSLRKPDYSMKHLFPYFFMPILLLLHCSRSSPTESNKDGSPWSLDWQDSFEQELHERWSKADWTFDNNLCEFHPSMVTTADSNLHLKIGKKNQAGQFPDKPYYGSEVYTTAKYRYGKFVVEMQPNSPPGVVTSFFLMDGLYFEEEMIDWFEIDIEFPGTTTRISYALHYMVNDDLESTSKTVDLDFDAAEQVHEYTIEWTADSIRFLIDGEQSALFNDPNIMKELQHPLSIHMNYWVSSSGWAGEFNERRLPLQTVYDKISYYKPVDT